MLAQHRTRDDLDQHHDPQTVNHARLGAAVWRKDQHDHACIELVRIAFDALERGRRRPTRAIAGARFCCFRPAGQLACPSRMRRENTIDVVGQRHITALFDVERLFASALEAACAQFGEKPVKDRHAWPALHIECGAFAENAFARPVFESAPRGRLGHPLQCADGAATPCVENQRRRAFVGLAAGMR
ncbi:hypothetical protein [Burkholderia multivorans]|uniref:hypothetical protein n=1 Tax=Burkholderia multivorans TaxID=87883 RepID=UPI0011B26D8C|nr:hypothetical protein [Burkholderia multivorans]MBU9589642.1 hypothetical protein [Burkholderia multivorans]